MHRDIAQRRSRRREEAISVHNAKTHIKPINFDVGDFVLVAKRSTCHGKKRRLKWTGPRRIIRVVSDFIFEVEDLITGSYALIHSNRLKFYADSQLNVTEELLDTVEHNDPHLQTVTKLLDMRFNDHFERFEVLVLQKTFLICSRNSLRNFPTKPWFDEHAAPDRRLSKEGTAVRYCT